MKTLGNINPHTLAIVMKECVQRAIKEIKAQRITFTSEAKEVDYKNEEDLITSADTAAQEIYIKILNENFPKAGIIAEEKFARKCKDKKYNYYFTIDPLDGTKAFGRRQSHAVSTMLSFVFEGKVVAVTIGDPNTGEIFHTRPGSEKIHRIYELEKSMPLMVTTERPLKDQYLQLRCDPRKLSLFGQKVSNSLFKDSEVIGGSIGFTFARLWKGEVGGVLLEPGTGYQTPWDTCPVMGISQKMGFKFFLVAHDRIREYTFEPQEENSYLGQELLCIHESRISEFGEWSNANGFPFFEKSNPLSQNYINVVLDLGEQVFATDEKFKQWLQAPYAGFDGRKPIEMSYSAIKDVLTGTVNHE